MTNSVSSYLSISSFRADNRPAASAWPSGLPILVTDKGAAPGTFEVSNGTSWSHYIPLPGQLFRCTKATLPAAASWPLGLPIYVTDVGAAGSIYFSNGVRMEPAATAGRYNNIIAFVGDSQTQHGSYFCGGDTIPDYTSVFYLSQNFPNITSAYIRYAAVDGRCPTGSGSLTYIAGTMVWTAPGDTPGTPIDVTAGGFFYIPSGTANRGIILGLKPNTAPFSVKTDTVTVSGTLTATKAVTYGHAGWVEALLGTVLEDVYNYGISGDTSTGVLSRLPQVLASRAKIIVLMIGINDIDGTNATTAAATLATLLTNLLDETTGICAQIINSGKFLVLGTIAAGTDATTYKAAAVYEANFAIKQFAQKFGIDVFDCYAQTVDPVSSTAAHISDRLTSDNLHINAKGGFLIANREIVPILQKMVPQNRKRVSSALLYDATLSPRGNRFIRGKFLGTAGTLNTGVTGTVPTGVTLVRGNGTTTTCVSTAPQDGSPVARADKVPGNWWRLVITGNTGDYWQIYGSAFMTAGNFVAGDIVQATADVVISGTGIVGISSTFVHNNPSTSIKLLEYEGGDATNIMSDLGGDTAVLKLSSRKYKIPAGSPGNFQMSMDIQVNTGGTATILLQDWCIEKVTS